MAYCQMVFAKCKSPGAGRVTGAVFLAGSLAATLAQEIDVKKAQPADIGVINDIDVTVTNLTEEKLNHPPMREIKIERLEEPRKRKLTKPDPKLFEQKFSAMVSLELPDSAAVFQSYLRRDENIRKLPYLGDRNLFSPNQLGEYGGDLSESLALMTKALPTADPFTKEERAFLTDSESIGNHVSCSFMPVDVSSPRPRKIVCIFVVLGTTPEQAEMRSRALITLLDHGVCRPIQLFVFKDREPLCIEVRDFRRKLTQHQASINAVEGLLKSFADFTADMLPNLRVQQLQLDVDLAGVKARIATCEKLLAQPNLKPERRSQIEDVKVAAEIESSGFDARRAKSEEFIGKVKTLIDLREKLSNAELSRNSALSQISARESRIQTIDAAIHAFAPLPIVGNKITVQPLEWTQ